MGASTYILRSCLLLSALACAALPAAAAIIGSGGSATVIPAPASTELNQLQANDAIHVFAEQANVLLATAIAVDIDMPGTYQNGSNPPEASASIVAGVLVDSYFVHYDVTARRTENPGWLEFNTDVLGILIYTNTLDAGTDVTLGNVATTYIAAGDLPLRGLEFGNDAVTLSADRRRVDLTLRAGRNGVDQIRIITAADPGMPVPEPGTAALLAFGLAALAAARRR